MCTFSKLKEKSLYFLIARRRITLSKILLEIAQFCHWTKILAKSCHLLAKYLLYLPNLNKCKLYLPNTCYKYLLDLPNLNKYKLYLPNTCYKYWILAKYLLNTCQILAKNLISINIIQYLLVLAILAIIEQVHLRHLAIC